MCGRYGRRADKQRIAEWFHTRNTDVFYHDLGFAPSYNVAPQTFQPIIRLNSETGDREIAYARWGLVPFWAKDTKIAYSTINARAETVVANSMYREAMKKRRCLIPAEFFYEWQKIDAKTKRPFAISLNDGSMFAFAGLWEWWKSPKTQDVLETFCVITTDPNELMEKIHDRMPVILRPKDYDRWLEPGDPLRPPVDLLRPYPADEMKAWRVGKRVGSVKNDDATLIDPETIAPETDQQSGLLF